MITFPIGPGVRGQLIRARGSDPQEAQRISQVVAALAVGAGASDG